MDDMLTYLDQMVEPTIRDFEQNPTSVRHAFLACVAAFHAIDYLAYPKKRRSATLRQKFQKNSTEFAIVDDVAHSFKHVVVGDRRKPRLTAEQVIPRPPAYFGRAEWDLSNWNDPIGGVALDRERSVDLLKAVKKAVLFLRSSPGP
jgi:hypothetical protein